MKPTTEPTARLSSGRIVTESEVRRVLERAGLSYPLPPTRAAIYASQGAAPGTVSPAGPLDTGRGAGLTPAPCAGDGDAETLTMADHLEQHPEDAVCETCGGRGGYIDGMSWYLTDVECEACNGTGRLVEDATR